MLPLPPSCRQKNIIALSLVLALACFISACGHTHASPAPISDEEVLTAVNTYSLGHTGFHSLTPSTLPDDNWDTYNARIVSLLVQEDFAQLEKIAALNREEKGRLAGGFFKSFDFYRATAYPTAPSDETYQERIALLKKWIAAFPASATARISLAQCYLGYADFVRGSGLANTVSGSQWRLYQERTTMAERTLLDATSLAERDVHWYAAMQQIARNDGWSKLRARQLLDQAVAFEPDYYHLYWNYAWYLLPRWHGQKGDIQALANEVSAKSATPYDSILYFQIMTSIACYCGEDLEAMYVASYPRLRDGYFNLTPLWAKLDERQSFCGDGLRLSR